MTTGQEEQDESRVPRKTLLVVNTGNGKGKTTAALGVLFRAWGRGYNVCMLQFIKINDQQLRRKQGREEGRHRDHLARRRVHVALEGHREGQGAGPRPVGAVQGEDRVRRTTTSSPSTSSPTRWPTVGFRSTKSSRFSPAAHRAPT